MSESNKGRVKLLVGSVPRVVDEVVAHKTERGALGLSVVPSLLGLNDLLELLWIILRVEARTIKPLRILFHRVPELVHVHGRREDVQVVEAIAVLLQQNLAQLVRLPRTARTQHDSSEWKLGLVRHCL
jgi:hypothetical protein